MAERAASEVHPSGKAATEAWQGRSRGTPFGYRIFISLLRYAGLKAAYALLIPVGLYYRVFAKDAMTPLYELYRKRLLFPREETERLIRRNIRIFGQSLIDKTALQTGAGSRLTFFEDGIEHLQSLAASGSGGFIVSAHLGNWEVAGQMLRSIGTRVHVLMYDGEDAALKTVTAPYEAYRSFNTIYIRDDLSHVFEVSAAIARGELVCLLADRFRPGARTIIHDFLGMPAHFPAGPFMLLSKLRAPVCYVFAIKESTFHYHFRGWPAKTYTGAEAALHDFVQLLEAQVQAHPEQWFNYYDFWAARP